METRDCFVITFYDEVLEMSPVQYIVGVSSGKQVSKSRWNLNAMIGLSCLVSSLRESTLPN